MHLNFQTGAGVEFWVPGKARPQGSKTVGRWGGLRESDPELGPWRERVALAAHGVMDSRQLIGGPVILGTFFVLPRISSEPKRRTRPHTRKPDLDKLVRAIGDALTHVVLGDDGQVTATVSSKRTALAGEEPGCWICIHPGDFSRRLYDRAMAAVITYTDAGPEPCGWPGCGTAITYGDRIGYESTDSAPVHAVHLQPTGGDE